jgi:hypothetical protein
MGLKYSQRNVKQTNVEKHRSAQRETEQQIDSDQSFLAKADSLS